MVTTVGTGDSPETIIENLLYLEHDAIAAYESVIERLENPEFSRQIERFRQDHLDHVEKLREFAGRHGVKPPAEGDMKEMLTTGKIGFANMVGGDATILRAMSTNEADTVSAYSSATENADLPEEMRPFVAMALADEERHKAWMEETAKAA